MFIFKVILKKSISHATSDQTDMWKMIAHWSSCYEFVIKKTTFCCYNAYFTLVIPPTIGLGTICSPVFCSSNVICIAIVVRETRGTGFCDNNHQIGLPGIWRVTLSLLRHAHSDVLFCSFPSSLRHGSAKTQFALVKTWCLEPNKDMKYHGWMMNLIILPFQPVAPEHA